MHYENALMSAKVVIEKSQNRIIKLVEESRLKSLDHEIIGNQLKNMYKAIDSLSGKKFIEDKFTFEIANLNQKHDELVSKNAQAELHNRTLLTERDRLRTELKDMVKSRMMIIKDKEIYAKATKDRIFVLESELQQQNAKLADQQDEFAKLDKSFKMMSTERDKLKEHLARLKNKRQRVDVNQKFCKK